MAQVSFKNYILCGKSRPYYSEARYINDISCDADAVSSLEVSWSANQYAPIIVDVRLLTSSVFQIPNDTCQTISGSLVETN